MKPEWACFSVSVRVLITKRAVGNTRSMKPIHCSGACGVLDAIDTFDESSLKPM